MARGGARGRLYRILSLGSRDASDGGAARDRAAVRILGTIGVPLAIGAGAVAWRLAGIGAGIATIAIGLTLSLLIALRLAARFDQDWLIRTLDARRPDMEDSAALLFADDATLGPLQRLQPMNRSNRDTDFPAGAAASRNSA